MKKLASIAVALALALPSVALAQAANLTGKWTGTLTRSLDDGRTQSIDFVFHLTHKAKALTGTAGPNEERQGAIEKGVVDGAKVTFQVQQPDGPLRKCTLTHAKERLTGDMVLEFNGQTATVKVDMGRAK